MSRSVRGRSHRKSKQHGQTSHREPRSLDPIQMRRYLAFVRAVVGVGTKGSAR